MYKTLLPPMPRARSLHWSKLTPGKSLHYPSPYVMPKIPQPARHICFRGWHGSMRLTTGTRNGMRRKSGRLLPMRRMFTSTGEPLALYGVR